MLSLLQNLDCGLCATQPNRGHNPVVWVNPAFERITGYSLDEIAGRDPRFLHSGLAPEAAAIIRHAVDCRVPSRAICQFCTRDERRVWVELTIQHAGKQQVGILRAWPDSWQQKLDTLTEQQQRIFGLLINGYSGPMAAKIVGVSERRLYQITDSITWRLEVSDVSQLLLTWHS